VLSFDASGISVERKGGSELVFMLKGGVPERIAAFPRSGRDAQELLMNLFAAAKKPVRTVIEGKLYILTGRIHDSSGENGFDVAIDPAPEPDPSAAPTITPKQGQIQQYFRVSAPSIHEMLKTLERNGLIRRTPRQARSIQILVQPEFIPALE
jgi:hypothetical protein